MMPSLEMQSAQKTIWTIGHSTRPMDEFIQLLQSYSITQLADVRHFPGSRKYPHFNKDELHRSLADAGIAYEHIESLGGRRKPNPDSQNTSWRHAAFRGYADYMETQAFMKGIERLEEIAKKKPTAYMCSEAVWWRCHRSLISDYLKVKGWLVYHIMAIEKATEHPFSSPAKIIDGKLAY